MSTRKSSPGRENQKWRTRKEILRAAQRLLAKGKSPTLEEVAEEARVSRATIYRYFSNINLILLEAPLDALTVDATEILQEAGDDPVSRAERVQEYFHVLVEGNEMYFRSFLRAAMDQWLSAEGEPPDSPRQARRVEAHSEALSGVRDHMDPETFERLVNALSALTSIEAYIAFRDVCGLTPEEAAKTGAWAVRHLVTSTLSSSPAKTVHAK